jgi:pimeloyl-ACP methyl ester carboxylesterase
MLDSEYSTHLVVFPSEDQLMLPGLLFQPLQPTQKVAIFVHGNGSASVFYSVKRMSALAQQFTQQGIALLAFNNRGAHFIKTVNKFHEPKENFTGYDDVTLGTAYELIKDCVYDINGAMQFLKQQKFSKFYLIGHSSGANKICVYDHYQPQNEIDKYVLLSGGDDTGFYYQQIGDRDKFFKYLEQAKNKIEQGRGEQLIPKYIMDRILSYQSFYDVSNPDGDYNTFPFTEYLKSLELSTQPLFRYFKAIQKPSLVLYGENDAYSPNKSGRQAIKILRQQVKNKSNFEFKLILKADHSFHGQEDELGQVLAHWCAGD